MQKISDVEAYLVSSPVKSGLNDATRKVEDVGFVVVRILTDQGLCGIGVTYNEVGGEAVRSLILNSLKPKLIGRDPFETEVIWQEFFHYLRGVGRKGLTFCALSAIDFALWDLKGKILNIPLYRLLGGNNPLVPVYASGGWTSYNLEQLIEETDEMLRRGYSKIKIKVGVDGGTNPREDARRIRKVREHVGDKVEIMLDANNAWDSATAVQFANSVRDLDILFLEEPVFADDIPGLRRYKRGADIPLATGEHEYTKFGARDLIMNEAVDILQIDAARCGGITEGLKVAAIAQAWNIRYAPHAMEHMHMQLVAAIPNGWSLERLFLFEEITLLTFKDAPEPQNGYMRIPDLPGLGLELDMDFIRENHKIPVA